ncbi:hypothetical protein ABZX12_26300 [Kribbella sp. NPDC003505]|uniref:hypothetical protein n=1 Tax=Kribbella sp. NPDC003505 TaxID=3154448 RepID=UPI0033BA067F
MNYGHYPQGETLGLPPPPLAAVAASWFVFTAFGVFGLRLLLQGKGKPAAWLLAVYATSGLIGIGHYLVEGATDMVWWRQIHVCADIICGVVIMVLAVRLSRWSPCTRRVQP